jgi:hypothetical protein
VDTRVGNHRSHSVVIAGVSCVPRKHRSKRTQTQTRLSADLPRQLHLSPVTTDQKGDEYSTCINRTVPHFRDFTGPIKSGGCHNHHGRDSGGVLVEFRGNEAPMQEGPFWGPSTSVFPVCVWSRMPLTPLLCFSYLCSRAHSMIFG